MTPERSKKPRAVDAPDVQSLLPLTPAVVHIMLALATTDLHGYAIMGEIERLSGGSFTIGPGTLYRSLQRMERDGLIAETAGPVDPEWTDERRRYYRLTELGRHAGEAEVRRFAALVEIAEGRGLFEPTKE